MIFHKYYKSFFILTTIVVLSTIPGNNLKKPIWLDFEHLDKIGHFSMYALLSFIVLYDLKKLSKFSLRTSFIISFFLSVSVGGILEIIQGAFVYRRSCDFFDFTANSLGAAVGILIFYWIFKNLKFRRHF